MNPTDAFAEQYPLLSRVNNPTDIKTFAIEELIDLAQEIRSLIIETVAKFGGHLASNLGTVELSIALHYAFNSPEDRFIWDVGHQIYTHKILTGRNRLFQQGLRVYKGLAGFPKKEESPHDHYDNGHSGTSISFALGIAEALHNQNSKNRAIAIIGDGSMTSGMAFEALNHAGQLKNENLIVILNDNEMSISPNVGALSEYISRRMVSPRPAQIRRTVKGILQSIPRAGSDLVRLAQKLERSIKELVQPGLLFEEFGFQYAGPFDGHDLKGLIEIFENISFLPGPMLIHVLTKKGYGYKPAETEPERFHGAPSFDIATGVFKEKPAPPSYTSVFGDAIVDAAKKDERIIAITAAMTLGTGLTRFAREFPGKFYDVGIAEQHAVTFAAGMALAGFKPVVAIYSTFLQRAYDQVFHDVCLQKLPVVFAIDRAGLVGADGSTHHGVFDLSYLRHLPGIAIIAPRDENELRRAVLNAPDFKIPVAIRYPRGNGIGVKIDLDPDPLELGKGELLVAGKDLTLLAAGPLVNEAVEVAESLSKLNISIEVIDAKFIKPLDSELIIRSIQKTRRLIIIEENALAGGFNSAVMEMLVGYDISLLSIDRIGIPDYFVGVGTQKELRNDIGMTQEEIKRRIQIMVSKNRIELKNGIGKSRPAADPARIRK